MTILAYVLVILLSQFMLTGGMLLSVLLSALIEKIPAFIRAPATAFVGGIAGSMLAVVAANWIFTWLAGPRSFGLAPFLAATVPLTVPILNDFRKYRRLRLLERRSDVSVARITAPMTAASGAMPTGAIVGVGLGALLFL